MWSLTYASFNNFFSSQAEGLERLVERFLVDEITRTQLQISDKRLDNVLGDTCRAGPKGRSTGPTATSNDRLRSGTRASDSRLRA